MVADYQDRQDIDYLLRVVDDLKYVTRVDDKKILVNVDELSSLLNELRLKYYDKSEIDLFLNELNFDEVNMSGFVRKRDIDLDMELDYLGFMELSLNVGD